MRINLYEKYINVIIFAYFDLFILVIMIKKNLIGDRRNREGDYNMGNRTLTNKVNVQVVNQLNY